MNRRLVNRLALLYTGFFLVTGLVLLAVAEIPLWTADHTRPVGSEQAGRDTSNLPELLRYSVLALVALTVLSAGLGRLAAHHALRPLRTLTASARAISAADLPGRLRVEASYREFTELADTLDGLARRLAAAFAAQRHFVANASHELRTPIAAQRTLLQVTLGDPDATAESLRTACEQALLLGEEQERLIGALLTLAHGQRGLERRTPVDLAELVRTAVAARAPHDVRVDLTLAPAVVPGDPQLLAVLAGNLVDNALRHNVAGGSVTVTVTADGALSIGNTGPLIRPEDVGRLFEPFARYRTERTRATAGHGLGLAIVAAVAEAHGARLTATARPRGGLDVTVRLPPVRSG